MPEIGDTWTPSMPFPLTDRELKEIRDQKRADNRAKNEAKNFNRRNARQLKKNLPADKVIAGKQLRRSFGGAFGRAPENVKFMASQGVATVLLETKEDEGDEEDG